MIKSTSNSKPIIMAIGPLGVGKSTVLNRLIGSEIFRCSNSHEVINRDFFAFTTADFTILESPGFCVMDFDVKGWIYRFEKSPYHEKPVDLVLMCLKASRRYCNEDRFNLQVMFGAIKHINAKNVKFIITGVDRDPDKYTQSSVMHNLQLLTSASGFDCPAESNVFLFNGETSAGVEATD